MGSFGANRQVSAVFLVASALHGILHRRSAALLSVLLAAGCARGGERASVDLAAERAELLRLHAVERDTHLGKDAARLVSMFSEDFRNVARGEVTQPSAEESRSRLQAYFDRSTFLAWDDLEPPVARLSQDGTMAYVIVRKLVHVRAPDSTGTPVEERTVFAWTETWEKRNGEWKLTSVTSTDDRTNP